MATGAGKTRTAIALCDPLMRCHWVTTQLYLAPSLAASQSQADALDPTAFIVSAIFLFCVAVSATYVPARRALRVDPVVALQ